MHVESRAIGDEAVTVTRRDGVLAVEFSPQARANRVPFTAQQLTVIRRGLEPGVWCVAAGARTGKTAVVAQLARAYFLQGKRVLLVTHSNACLNETVTRVLGLGVPASCVVRLGHGEAELKETTGVEFGKRGRLQQAFEDREAVLASCRELARACGVQDEQCQTLETARHFLRTTTLEKASEGGVLEEERVLLSRPRRRCDLWRSSADRSSASSSS